jgi:hypothetical protein
MTQRKGDILISVTLIGFSIFMYFLSYHFSGFRLEKESSDIGPSYIPRLILFFLAFSSACLILLRLHVRKKEKRLPISLFSQRPIAILCGFILYIGLAMVVGYGPSTFLFLLISFLILGVRKVWILLFLPPTFTLMIYYIFEKLLKVWLPKGLFF